MQDTILFILNPISGFRGTLRKRIRYEIVMNIRQKKINGEIRYSRYSGHSAEIARDAVKEGYKYIVVAGGDGSINEVAKELVGTDVALGIIPAGSGNGLAHSLNIPFNVKKCLEIIKRKNVQFADVIQINERVAVSVAGIGFDANVANKYSKYKRRGFMSYLKSVIEEYFDFKGEKVKIITDDFESEVEVFSVVFANSNQFGYNFKIAPKASVFDGFIDVILIKPFPLIAAPFSSMRVFSGQADKSVYISSFKTKHIKVIREKIGNVNLDGDAITIDNQVIEAKVLEKSLKIII